MDSLEDFESRYCEELQMMNDDNSFLPGPPSRRSLDLRSPCPAPATVSSRKRPRSSESPLPLATPPGPPHKVQCLPDHLISPHQEHSSTTVTYSRPPSTPSRPAVAVGSVPSARHRQSVAIQKPVITPSAMGENNEDPIYGSMPSPPSPPTSPPNSPPLSPLMCGKQLSVECAPHRTPSHQERQGHIATHSFTRDQRTLNHGILSSPAHTKTSEESLMNRFNTVYQSLNSQPSAEFESEAYDGSCSPVLDRMTLTARSNVEDSPVSSRVLTRVPACPYITVTGSDGERVYLKIQHQKSISSSAQRSTVPDHLLPVSFSQLLSSVQKERRRKLIEHTEQLLQSVDSVAETEAQAGSEAAEAEEDGVRFTTSASHTLWVDKYAPRHYTHLLSDDGINRTLLSWIRLWDETVFGYSSLSTATAVKAGRAAWEKGRGSDSGVRGGRGDVHMRKSEWKELVDPVTFASEEALDESRRPRVKLALLCGAPGLGKTTLAHIIAKHAGYHVVEMNASDDRSADVFRQKLEATTQTQAVLTPDSRPTCLIIDEIDGAPMAAINVLIDFVKKKDSGKKKKRPKVLSRPVICICNDQYAPSLRQLRQYALVLMFPPTLASRLASRLQQIIRQEQMISSLSTLMALCEKADSDIRACLNTLQFISRQQSELTVNLVQSASVGQKDAQMSLFSLWKQIFQLPSVKRRPIGHNKDTSSRANNGGHGMGTSATRFYHMHSAASATGEYEKVCHGLFENYLNIRFKDPNLEAVCVGLDWMSFHDILQQHIAQTQNYTFWSYLPYLSVAFHFLFASPSKPYIRFPHTNFEMIQKMQKNEHLLSSVMLEVPAHIHRMLTSTQLAMEMLTPIQEIITPTFRPVSTQLYTAREKQQLADLVDTMISYGLTYKQEKGLDGQYTYILDPCLEEVCQFPGLAQRKQLSYSAKQLIAREVEVEKMRRMEKMMCGKAAPPPTTSDGQKSANRALAAVNRMPQEPKVVKLVKEKPAIDFFGRKVKSGGKSAVGGSTAAASPMQHPLWFRFNEGFSNAVRRPVRIQDLL